jgi:hypothetical protein
VLRREGEKSGKTLTLREVPLISQVAQLQEEIDTTVGVMRENLNKMAERGENLDHLQDKTGKFVWFSYTIVCEDSRVQSDAI